MPTWIIGPLAIAAVAWVYSLANRPRKDGIHFRPVVFMRIFYPAFIIALPVMTAIVLADFIHATEPTQWNDWLSLALMPVFWVALVITSPPTVTVLDGGLQWHQLLIRRRIPWSEIEAAVATMDNRVVIYCRSGKQREIGPMVEGRSQLASIINHKIAALKS